MRILIVQGFLLTFAPHTFAGPCSSKHLPKLKFIRFQAAEAEPDAIIPDSNLIQAHVVGKAIEPVFHETIEKVKEDLSRVHIGPQEMARDSSWKDHVRPSLREFLGIWRQQKEAKDSVFFKAIRIFQLYRQGRDYRNANEIEGAALSTSIPEQVYAEIFNKDYERTESGLRIREDTAGFVPFALGSREVRTGYKTLGLEVSRSDERYQEALRILRQSDVGGKNGEADREIVADTFFAKKSSEKAANLIFATYDIRLVRGLLRLKKYPEKQIDSILNRLSEGQPLNTDKVKGRISDDVFQLESLNFLDSPFQSNIEGYQFVFLGISNIPLHIKGESRPRLIDVCFGISHQLEIQASPESPDVLTFKLKIPSN